MTAVQAPPRLGGRDSRMALIAVALAALSLTFARFS